MELALLFDVLLVALDVLPVKLFTTTHALLVVCTSGGMMLPNVPLDALHKARYRQLLNFIRFTLKFHYKGFG